MLITYFFLLCIFVHKCVSEDMMAVAELRKERKNE
jgi:hypothetical protein